MALSHTVMLISGGGRNPGPGHSAPFFSIGPKGSFSYQNHRQSHTMLHIYTANEPPADDLLHTGELEGHPCKY